MKKQLFVAALAAISLSSCYCDKYYVGNITPSDEVVHVASVRNNHYIGGALVHKDNTKNNLPGVNDYIIETKQTFGDILVTCLTSAIYSPTTTKYYVKKDNPKVVVEKQKFKSKAYKGSLKK